MIGPSGFQQAPKKLARYVDITEIKTGEIVHSVNVTSKDDRAIEKIIRGMLINLNRDDFCVGERAA